MKTSAYVIEIEQSEKETGKTMHNTRHELAKLITQNERLQQENQQLKKQKDDGVEYIKENVYIDYYGMSLFREKDGVDKLLRILGETDE